MNAAFARRLFAGFLGTSLICGPVSAQETVTYKYDALGRLETSATDGGSNSGANTRVIYDAAGNRTEYIVNKPAPNPCTLGTQDVVGSDGNSVSVRLTKTGPCTQTISVDYTIQSVSGSGPLYIGNIFPGKTLSPSEQEISLILYSGENQNPPGNPLKIKVIWSVKSGNAVISPAESLVTFYNDSCYC